MPRDLESTRAAVEALNTPGSPWRLAMDGVTVTGEWRVVDATFSGPGTSGATKVAYSLTAELDPASGRYTVSERTLDESSFGSAVPSARSGARWSSSTTKGHVVKRSFGTVRAPLVLADGELSSRLDYDAVSTQLTRPLEAALAAHGWTRKRGALARLLGF